MKMLRSHLQVFSVALFCSVLLARVCGAPHTNMLTELLRADLTGTNRNSEDLTHLLLLKLTSDLVAEGENEVVVPEEGQESAGREELSRRHLSVAQRERKAGCRNFFWKTFTSC